MARRPIRHRERRANADGAAVADGFAAPPVPLEEVRRREPVDNSAASHMRAILNSGLVDEISNEGALDRAWQVRASDGFGAAFEAYRRRVDAEQRGTVDGAGLIAAHGDGADGTGRVPAIRGRNEIAPRGPETRMVGDRAEDWMKIRELGGYVVSQIRRLGRDLFEQYCDLPIEDVSVVGSLTHGERRVRSIVEWVCAHGTEIDDGDVDFGRNVPGYNARTSLWVVGDFNFLVVADNHGEYVYGWPARPQLLLNAAPGAPRLR